MHDTVDVSNKHLIPILSFSRTICTGKVMTHDLYRTVKFPCIASVNFSCVNSFQQTAYIFSNVQRKAVLYNRGFFLYFSFLDESVCLVRTPTGTRHEV